MPHSMRTLVQRSFLLFFACWLLLSSIGVAWTQSTCLFTGIQQVSWTEKKSVKTFPETQIRRSTCFHFKHFQIKHQSAFASKKQFNQLDLPLDVFIHGLDDAQVCLTRSVLSISPQRTPPVQSVRRAFLQVYLI